MILNFIADELNTNIKKMFFIILLIINLAYLLYWFTRVYKCMLKHMKKSERFKLLYMVFGCTCFRDEEPQEEIEDLAFN